MKQKRGFALLITIILVVVISYLSYSIVQSNIFSSNLNKLKYLHLQANIHLDFIKEYIATHTQTQIDNVTLDDQRFELSIVSRDQNTTMVYYIYLKTVDDTPIRLSDKIIK
ncbi:MAG: hypothetical protein K8R39_10835 [Arcobacteraceae bacterium]|nr:hypothetical protein [Arcobacteraceae bacterium]